MFFLLLTGACFAVGAAIQVSAIIGAIVLVYIFVRTCTAYAAPELGWMRWIGAWLARQLDGIGPLRGLKDLEAGAGDGSKRPKIYAYHPHGVYAVTPLVHTLRGDISASLITVPFITNFPIVSLIIRALGIIPSDRDTLRTVLGRGDNLAILVGGMREAEKTVHGVMNLCANRKGIFELAIETGAEIIPTLCYGENELFHPWKPFEWLQTQLKKVAHMTIIFPYMSDLWKLLSEGCPRVTTYIGDPIVAAEGETVESLRVKYMAAFETLYEQTRAGTGYMGPIQWS